LRDNSVGNPSYGLIGGVHQSLPPAIYRWDPSRRLDRVATGRMHARSEMLIGTDFRSWEMRWLAGDARAAKGMALFRRSVGGRYAMLGRQDSGSIWLLFSDDPYTW